jgi:hypothetical protein
LALIRPAMRTHLQRWREVLLALIAAALALWITARGGYFFVPLGLVMLAAAAAWAIAALRRMRFAQHVAAPGLVEVDEGQIGYLGPEFGGYVALQDLVELRLVRMYGRRMWRLKQADGQAVMIPVDAAGADRLFDAFASLPGIDTAALIAALDAPQAHAAGGLPVPLSSASTADLSAFTVIWRRQAVLTTG